MGSCRVLPSSALLAQVLLEIATDPAARNADRIAAAREILDRGWAKQSDTPTSKARIRSVRTR